METAAALNSQSPPKKSDSNLPLFRSRTHAVPAQSEESIPTKAHFDVVSLNRRQRALDFVTCASDCSPIKLQGDVQRFRPHPTRLRSNPRTPSRKRTMRLRMLSSRSSRYEKAHKKLVAVSLKTFRADPVSHVVLRFAVSNLRLKTRVIQAKS